MPDSLISQFDRKYAQPIETFRRVNDISARNAISTLIRWEGMLVYVLSDQTTYQLTGGTTNGDWQNVGGYMDVFVVDNLNSNLTTAALSANQGSILNSRFNDYQALSEKGAANGYAPLGSDSKIPSAYLPGYVDDVLEFANLAAFPDPGETGVLYIAIDTNFTYRWGGSSYVQIGGGGAGEVDSVFGRVGAITAQAGDYSSFYLRRDVDSTLDAIIYGSDSSPLIQVIDTDNAYVGSTGRNNITLASTNNPRYRDNSGTYYTLWHSGNDGPGSGLNADLLDGYSWESVGVNIRSSKTTARVDAYQDSTRFARLQGSTDGGALILAEGGGTTTTIISYGDSELQGGGLMVGGVFSNKSVGTVQIKGDGPSGGLVLWNEDNATTKRIWVDDAEDRLFLTSGSASTNGAYLNNVGQFVFQQDTYFNDHIRIGTGATIYNNTSQSRSKIRVWNTDSYGIGMQSGYTFGGLGNEYAMTFQMNPTTDRGFWWGTDAHSNAQGSMSLTNDGRLTVASYMRLGYGTSDTTTPGTTYRLQVNGQIQASDFKLSSDIRLKKRVKNLSVRAIPVRWVSYIRKNDNSRGLGVVANELEENFPEFVTTDEQGYKAVSYIDLLIAKVAYLESLILK